MHRSWFLNSGQSIHPSTLYLSLNVGASKLGQNQPQRHHDLPQFLMVADAAFRSGPIRSLDSVAKIMPIGRGMDARRQSRSADSCCREWSILVFGISYASPVATPPSRLLTSLGVAKAPGRCSIPRMPEGGMSGNGAPAEFALADLSAGRSRHVVHEHHGLRDLVARQFAG